MWECCPAYIDRGSVDGKLSNGHFGGRADYARNVRFLPDKSVQYLDDNCGLALSCVHELAEGVHAGNPYCRAFTRQLSDSASKSVYVLCGNCCAGLKPLHSKLSHRG